jgi:SAM-dependent methyltransferase
VKANSILEVAKWFNREIRKHPSFLLFDMRPTNFFIPSETYARSLWGGLDKGLRILDVGCGDALDSITLAASSNKVWAIDIALNRLELAQEQVKKANLTSRILPICMDAHNLAFPDNFFDLIIGNSVLIFLDRTRFAEECYRVLKPGGQALFSNESMKNHPLLIMWRTFAGLRERESVTKRINLHDIDELNKRFDYINHREFYLLSVLFSPALMRYGERKLVFQITNYLYRLDKILLQLIPPLRNLCWISVIDLGKRAEVQEVMCPDL